MYQRLPAWVLGFHGTDEETVEKILNGSQEIELSRNPWDWLGNGAYFWENDPERALHFSKLRMSWKGIDKKPAVIGAVIDLGLCLNLFDQPALKELKAAYADLAEDFRILGVPLPENDGKSADKVMRFLDRAVVEHLHSLRQLAKVEPYSTVRAPFMEGPELYRNTTFREFNHIQIAVRDLACIKGYFRPRSAPPKARRRARR